MKNIIFNYLGQGYMAIIGIVMTPVYVSIMGVESYGLIGFYTMIQAWFQLFDLGFSATIGRQAALYNSGSLSAIELRSLFRVLQCIFVTIVCLVILGTTCLSVYIAHAWIKIESLSLPEVEQAVRFIFFIVAFRWMSSLYRGVINGFEAQIWLNKFNVLFASLKFVCVIFVFNFLSKSIDSFFAYQLLVTLAETLILTLYAHHLMPKTSKPVQIKLRILLDILPFSLSIAFTSSIWVFVTQLDKLILSKLLTLEEYGCFSLAVVVTGGINTLTMPISVAILPRLSRLSAENAKVAFISLYNKITQFTTVLIVPISVVLIFFSEKVLYAWTGNTSLSIKTAPILQYYVIGNTFLAVSALPYYLQFAKGNVRLHVIGNLLFALLMLPLLVVATFKWRATGAGYVWALSNLLYFLIWTPKIHRYFLGRFHCNWMVKNIGLISLTTVFVGFLSDHLVTWSQSRWILSMQLIGFTLVLILITSLQSKFFRNYISLIRYRFGLLQEV